MRNLVLCSLALAAAACDASDRTTAPRAPDAPSADLTVGPAQPPVYTGYSLTDISGGVNSAASDINDHGTVVGRHTVNGVQHGFIRHRDGTVEDIPPMHDDASNVASGVDGADNVVGTSTDALGRPHAWFKAPGFPMVRLADANCQSQSRANAIDDGGEVVGDCGTLPAVWPTRYANVVCQCGYPGTYVGALGTTGVGYSTLPGNVRQALPWYTDPSHPALPDGTTSSWYSGANVYGDRYGGYDDATGERGFVESYWDETRLLPHPVLSVTGRGRVVGWYVAIPAVAYTIAPDALAETTLPPARYDRVAVKANLCGSIVGWYFPLGLQAGPRAALWTKPHCD